MWVFQYEYSDILRKVRQAMIAAGALRIASRRFDPVSKSSVRATNQANGMAVAKKLGMAPRPSRAGTAHLDLNGIASKPDRRSLNIFLDPFLAEHVHERCRLVLLHARKNEPLWLTTLQRGEEDARHLRSPPVLALLYLDSPLGHSVRYAIASTGKSSSRKSNGAVTLEFYRITAAMRRRARNYVVKRYAKR